jgi:hypothetical protein
MILSAGCSPRADFCGYLPALGYLSLLQQPERRIDETHKQTVEHRSCFRNRQPGCTGEMGSVQDTYTADARIPHRNALRTMKRSSRNAQFFLNREWL